ncbi:hypothetical protein [Azospirillum endophyticum]
MKGQRTRSLPHPLPGRCPVRLPVVRQTLAHRKAVRVGGSRCSGTVPDGDPSRCRPWSRRRSRRIQPARIQPVRTRTASPPAPSSGTGGSSCPPFQDRRRRPSIGPATGPDSGAPAIRRTADRRKTDRRVGLVSTGRPWPDYRWDGGGLTSPAWFPT